MFTRIAKGILIFGMIISFIGLIGVSVFVYKITRSSLGSFEVFLLGLAIMLVLFTALGVIVEMAINVEEIRYDLRNKQTFPAQTNPQSNKTTHTLQSYRNSQ